MCCLCTYIFFCKQKTAYEMRISDWSSDVCASDLVLRERFQIARRLKADLFISVHCDSADNPDATGATVYTLSEVASDKEAARLAARENRADIPTGRQSSGENEFQYG